MDGWNTSFLLGWPIFRGYVSFREGKHPTPKVSDANMTRWKLHPPLLGPSSHNHSDPSLCQTRNQCDSPPRWGECGEIWIHGIYSYTSLIYDLLNDFAHIPWEDAPNPAKKEIPPQMVEASGVSSRGIPSGELTCPLPAGTFESMIFSCS